MRWLAALALPVDAVERRFFSRTADAVPGRGRATLGGGHPGV